MRGIRGRRLLLDEVRGGRYIDFNDWLWDLI